MTSSKIVVGARSEEMCSGHFPGRLTHLRSRFAGMRVPATCVCACVCASEW